ncbi:iron complex outermembrane receptor protein [termite gut metagenome]|uniref:Iron complex outermembrane receptor protein n=1 Tax=termite gut metagenome TaxID=433724 RepID=A0A5J4RP45_9ZZZZ
MFIPVFVYAQNQLIDTTRVYPLSEITVSQRRQTREVRTVTPVQIFFEEQLKKLNVLQLSDAVKHFAGVTVKDYGGIGGLKTVSLRSLGAEHTSVGYDGITLSDMQTGQVDLSRISMENMAQLTLTNGQSDDIFQPARFFASASVLNIQTITPSFTGEKSTKIGASLKAGSWGLVNPSVSFDKELNECWTFSVNGNWLSADGRYPYTLYYGSETDSISHEKRKNTEVQTLKAEAGLFGNFSHREQWKLKIRYYQSSRGLPGATTLYYDYASQHLYDKTIFIQSHYKKELSRRWIFQTSAKWSWSYQQYLDPDYKGMEGEIENSYYNKEYYLTASLWYKTGENLSFSVSTDGSINLLNADLKNFAYPTRYAWLTAVAGKYTNERITVIASLLNTHINEKTRWGACAGNHTKRNPYAGISFKPFSEQELHIRAFYKDIFRLPTFNDLYYSETGNANLQPENATQYNLGVTYEKKINSSVPFLSIIADMYCNKVTNKIVALPTKNLFVWSVVNLGQVNIKGIDVSAHIRLQPWQKTGINLSGNYTYQQALDVTDPNGKTFKHQIAYTPRVSASGQASLIMSWFNLSYTFLFSGKRYVLGQNSTENRINGYSDHSLSVNKEFKLGRWDASLTVEAINFLDKNYEIVRYFPMPGRSVRATLKINY